MRHAHAVYSKSSADLRLPALPPAQRGRRERAQEQQRAGLEGRGAAPVPRDARLELGGVVDLGCSLKN